MVHLLSRHPIINTLTGSGGCRWLLDDAAGGLKHTEACDRLQRMRIVEQRQRGEIVEHRLNPKFRQQMIHALCGAFNSPAGRPVLHSHSS